MRASDEGPRRIGRIAGQMQRKQFVRRQSEANRLLRDILTELQARK